MSQNDDFKVFQGNTFPGDGSPLVIISACISEKEIYADYYIFIQDRDNSFYSQSMTCKKRGISSIGLIIDTDFMMDYALESAKAKLSDHLYQKYQKTKERDYLYVEYKLSKSDLSALLRLYMRDQYKDKFEMLQKINMCPKLYKFFNGLINVPKVTLED